MSSRVRTILDTLVTALQAINGSGGYTHDVSATGRVQIGRPGPTAGPDGAAVWVALGAIKSGHGPELGRYRRDLEIDVQGRCSAADASAAERALIGADLLSDICRAIETDRTLSGGGVQVLDVLIDGATFDGDELGIPGQVVVFATLKCYFFIDAATGV